MEEVLSFLKEWSSVIIPGLVIFLDVLILVLKNRPKTNNVFKEYLGEVLNVLPGFINYFECPGDGEAKKQAVLESALELLSKKIRRSLSDRESDYSKKVISEQIEVILSTPQKKGD